MTSENTTSISKRLLEWRNSLYKSRYYLLLVALTSMLLLPAFIPEENEGLVWTVSRTLILLACFNVLRNLNRGFVAIIILGLVVAGSDWLTTADNGSDWPNLVSLSLFGFFVCLISYQVFGQVLKAKEVDFHIIMGAFCGFLLIGLITVVVCSVFHLLNPNSFSNVAPGTEGIDDILYFSYITILTIGYGDISPLTEAARRVSLFFGLIGQFYLVVIMAVLVGKFISKPNQ